MIFSKFTTDDVVAGRVNQVSSGMFATGSLTLNQTTFQSSSQQANSLTGSNEYDVKNGQYYIDVYSGGERYFSVAYGDYANSGSSFFNVPDNGVAEVYSNETKVIYSQYKNALLQPSDDKFSFANGNINTQIDSECIFVVNFSADKYQDQIDPGQIQINISGANGQFSYIDDSSVINETRNVYNLISGSVVNGVPTPYTQGGTTEAVYEGIGLFYPSNGIVVFNAIQLDDIVDITSGEIGSNRTDNNYSTSRDGYWRNWLSKFYNSIVKSNVNMSIRKSEFVPSTNYFIRVKNKEFNYSNNPTLVSPGGSNQKPKGTIIYQDLIANPKTYITTVGLYNDNNELLAIGKLSRPTQKSFDNELLIKCRIDF